MVCIILTCQVSVRESVWYIRDTLSIICIFIKPLNIFSVAILVLKSIDMIVNIEGLLRREHGPIREGGVNIQRVPRAGSPCIYDSLYVIFKFHVGHFRLLCFLTS